MACGGSAAEGFELITILKLGKKVQYTVPSFPVFTASLMEMKFQFVDGDSSTVYDGYIKDSPDLARNYPALLKILNGYVNGFTIEPDEFNRSVTLEDEKKLCDEKVFVIWKWTWENSPEQNTFPSADDSTATADEDDGSDQQWEEDEFTSTLITHSVIFKCMGTTKSVRSQEVLSEAATKLKNHETIEVRLRKEPTNPKDSRAIAFDCSLRSNHWDCIGYVVKEALDGVHQATEQCSIVTVNLNWVRYITHWSRCDPGWYCGIKITKKGDWSREVVRCSSTF